MIDGNETDIALEGSFREGEGAAGASAIRGGFTFGRTTDVAFALGFPYARQWSRDDTPIDVSAVIGAPRWRVRWPRSIGRARARVRGVDNVWIDEAGRVTPQEADVATRTTAVLSVEDAGVLVQSGVARTAPFGQLEMCLLLEADIGAAAILNVIADVLERVPADALRAYSPSHVSFAQFVGFALLRVPASEAPSLRDRFEAVVRRAPVEAMPYAISGALDRAIHGREGAERNGLPEGAALHPSSLWFVHDDPSFVRAQILANEEPYSGVFAADARCAFLGGADVIRYYVKRWFALDPRMTLEMLYDFGLMRDPAIVEFMVMASEEPEPELELATMATAWLESHRVYALPILESLAAGSRKRMAKASAEWVARLG